MEALQTANSVTPSWVYPNDDGYREIRNWERRAPITLFCSSCEKDTAHDHEVISEIEGDEFGLRCMECQDFTTNF